MIKPKALYIHIPFCNYICEYCDFPKLQYFSIFITQYLVSLKNEIDSYNIEELDTIYVGGGTPTSLSIDELKTLLEIIKPYSKGVKEYTFEANPDSLTKEKLALLHSYGVNRLSIGVESTSNEVLKAINRHHTYEDVVDIVNEARNVGFNNINLDLILGLPGSGFNQLMKDLENIVSLNPEHISCYSLTVNPHTSFYIKKIKEKDDITMRNYYDYTHIYLKGKGYTQYEISNWARDEKYSLHNLTYWKNDQFYGVGLGATAFIGNELHNNTKSINKYIKGNYKSDDEPSYDDVNQAIMLNLRTIFGLDLNKIKEKYNIDLYENRKKEIHNFIKADLLIKEGNIIRPTYEGMMLLDTILLKLFL